MPVRQPKPKRIGLRSARRGISKTIAELAVLKTSEAQVLSAAVEHRGDVLATVARISDKEAGLRAQIARIETEPENARVEGMKVEERKLDGEIKEVELRLYEMRARQRVLRGEIREAENSVQAKLSSYNNALALAEREARGFLARPPPEGGRVKMGVWTLPRERRTLEMVREMYGDEEESLKGRIEDVVKEREALEEGGRVWGDVVAEVMGVEEGLRAEMGRMGEGKREREKGMRRVLEGMGMARVRVEEKMGVAVERGWRLLVCAIGAEGEALGEGIAVLEGALRAVSGAGTGGEGDLIGDEGHDCQGVVQGPNNDGGGALLDRSEDEDDGPGPELLIEEHEDPRGQAF